MPALEQDHGIHPRCPCQRSISCAFNAPFIFRMRMSATLTLTLKKAKAALPRRIAIH
jgi:hypothetical protein